MTSKAALFALLALWGVGAGSALPARADESPADSTASEARTETTFGPAGFVNRVWQRMDTVDQPGLIRIFLSDGTLVTDSSWETHRLSSWTFGPDGGLAWNEDGKDIRARVKSLGLDRLVLAFDLKGGAVEEQYVAAPAPSAWPNLAV
jgi:hypothetical protein